MTETKQPITVHGWTLMRQNTREPIYTDTVVYSHRNEAHTLTGGRPPHKLGSTGRVWTQGGGEYFPTVFDLIWVAGEPE